MKASNSKLRNAGIVPTGIPKLDDLLGGGVGLKRITQFSGRSGLGKSTIALGVIKNAQELGMDTLYLDSESRFPFEYAEKLGVDLKKLDIEELSIAEDLFNAAEEWVAKNEGVIVLDSVGGLLSRTEAEKRSGEEGFPQAPKLVPPWMRRMSNLLPKHNCALVLLNHEKIDMFGALKVLGGLAVEYHTDRWIRVKKTNKKVMQGDKRVGDVIEVVVQKGPKKHQSAELTLITGEGFSIEADKLEQMLEDGTLTKTGNTYFHGAVKIGVGAAKAREYLKGL